MSFLVAVKLELYVDNQGRAHLYCTHEMAGRYRTHRGSLQHRCPAYPAANCRQGRRVCDRNAQYLPLGNSVPLIKRPDAMRERISPQAGPVTIHRLHHKYEYPLHTIAFSKAARASTKSIDFPLIFPNAGVEGISSSLHHSEISRGMSLFFFVP